MWVICNNNIWQLVYLIPDFIVWDTRNVNKLIDVLAVKRSASQRSAVTRAKAKWRTTTSDCEEEGPIEKAKRAGANLNAPKKASIARERKIQSNPSLIGKKRVTRGENDPKLNCWQRVQEHKGEHLTVLNGKLRCDACKETMSKKKSTVKKHVSSSKHIQAKKDLDRSKKKISQSWNCLGKMTRRIIPKVKHCHKTCEFIGLI